jgi:type II secretory pathway pseudopilin PulG
MKNLFFGKLLFYRFRQSAVMFGLDARIAIVIMGILGAIVSYYGSDKINDAQDTAILQQINSVRTAFLATMADNGGISLSSDITSINADGLNSGAVDSTGLYKGKQNYSYIQSPTFGASNSQIQTPLGNIDVMPSVYSSDVSTGAVEKTADCPVANSQCYYWLRLDNVPNEYYPLIEDYYDQTPVAVADVTNEGITGLVVIFDKNSHSVDLGLSIGRRED